MTCLVIPTLYFPVYGGISIEVEKGMLPKRTPIARNIMLNVVLRLKPLISAFLSLLKCRDKSQMTADLPYMLTLILHRILL